MADEYEPGQQEFIPSARPIPLARQVPVDGIHGFSAETQDVANVEPMLLLSIAPRAAWADIARAIVYVILFELVCGAILYGVLGSADGQAYLVPTAMLRTIFLPIMVGLILRYRAQSTASVGLHATKLGLNLIVGMGTALVAMIAVLITMMIIIVLWSGLYEEMDRNAQTIMEYVPNLSRMGLFVLTLMVGFYEELFFRGFLMTRLRRATGHWTPAVLLSTLVFVAPHATQVPIALVPITILSILFSLVTIWRKSLVPAIVAHVLWNFGQFVVLKYRAGDTWM